VRTIAALVVTFALSIFTVPAAATARASTAQLLESDPCLFPGFAQLLRGAHDDVEVAAFIADDDGSLAFLVWPVLSWFRSQEFRGTIPDRTLAVVHTHPLDGMPSVQDIHEAERLMLPSFVVTRRSVWVVDPETEPRVRPVAAQGWLRRAKVQPTDTCRRLLLMTTRKSAR
jgi:hypothetical protein